MTNVLKNIMGRIKSFAVSHDNRGFWFRLGFALALITAVFTVYLLMSPVRTITGTDFSKYITRASVQTKSGGEWTKTKKVVDGDKVKVTLTYEMPSGTLESGRNTQTLYCELPDNLDVKNVKNGKIETSDGTAASCSIDKKGILRIDYEEPVDETTEIAGTVSFTGNADKQNNEETEELKFNEDAEAAEIVEETKDSSSEDGKDADAGQTKSGADKDTDKSGASDSGETGTGTDSDKNDTGKSENAGDAAAGQKLAKELSAKGDDYTVTVSCDEKAGIPENAELKVKEIAGGSDEFEAYAKKAVKALNAEQKDSKKKVALQALRLFDISFVQDGKEIEPSAEVNVSITFKEGFIKTEDQKTSVVHFADKGTEVLDARAEKSGESKDKDSKNKDKSKDKKDFETADTFCYSQESFSIVATAVYDSDTLSGNDYALSINGGYITSEAAGTNSLKAGSEPEYWTFTNVDGYYTIKNSSGKYLAMDGSGNLITVTSASSDQAKWSVTVNGDGTIALYRLLYSYVYNTSYPQYINRSGGNGNFITYGTFDSNCKIKLYQENGKCTAWFDGTDGMGTSATYYSGATNTKQECDAGTTITLPSTAGSTELYDYELNGWYDVTHGVYYKPGDSVTIVEDTVFYAEWIAESYDFGSSSSSGKTVVSNQPDTSSFITTDVFDYNELFNLYSATLKSSKVTGDSHDETWGLDTSADSLDFAFQNWAYWNRSGEKSIAFLQDLDQKNRLETTKTATQMGDRILTSQDSDVIKKVFGTKTEMGKQYLGEGDKLYQYEKSSSSEWYGYYYYDSAKNAASYNKTEQRFYVYTQPEYINGQEWGTDGWYDKSSADTTAFLPFNDGSTAYDEKTGQTNYWFGIKSTVDFYLPDDPGSNSGDCNRAVGDKDMKFHFSGDDDVWVFVDDELVLDLSGIHGRLSGDINFSTGKVTTNGKETNLPSSIKSGDHKLTFYYLERGSSESNCSIYFNLAPRYSLELSKKDSESNKTLAGAEFGVYTNEACTIPASLWDTDDDDQKKTNIFTTDSDGKINITGLVASKTYYLKELVPPDGGYPDVTDETLTLKIDANGHATVSSTKDSTSWKMGTVTSTEDNTSTKGTYQLDLVINNVKKSKVTVQKKWEDSHGNEIEPDTSVTVELHQSSTRTTSSGSETDEEKHVVTFVTQYYADSEGAHGTNMDTANLYTGSVTKKVVVNDGDTLPFETVTNNGESLAIYSVTANHKPLNGTTSGMTSSNQQYQVNGNWVSLPTKGSYQLEDITKDQTVVITYIGYLLYEGSTPSFEKSVTLTTGTPIAGSGSGSTGTTSETTTETVDTVYDTVTLSGSTTPKWKKEWNDLPSIDEDGNPYYYYVKETSGSAGYTVMYNNNKGVTGGDITIINKKNDEPVDLTVRKVWSDGADQHTGDSIRFKVVQKDSISGEVIADAFKTGTLSDENKWSVTFDKDEMPAKVDGVIVTYEVVETSTTDGYTSSVQQVTTDNETIFTITNSKTEEPPDSDINIKKVWQDYSGNTLSSKDIPVSSISGKLYGHYTETSAAGVNVTINMSGANGPITKWSGSVASGSNFTVWAMPNGGLGDPTSVIVSSGDATVSYKGDQYTAINGNGWNANVAVYSVNVGITDSVIDVYYNDSTWIQDGSVHFIDEPQEATGTGKTTEGSDELLDFTLTSSNSWKSTFTTSQLEAKAQHDKYDYYYVSEVAVSGFESEVPSKIYQSEDGRIDVTITNRNNSVILQNAGGSGKTGFILGGLLLVTVAAALMYRRKYTERGGRTAGRLKV